MKLLNKILLQYNYIVIGLILGLFLSTLISLDVWLDMRIHSYKVILYSIIFVELILNLYKKINIFKLFIILEILFLDYIIIFKKFQRCIFDLKEFVIIKLSFFEVELLFLFIILSSNIIFFIKKLQNEF